MNHYEGKVFTTYNISTFQFFRSSESVLFCWVSSQSHVQMLPGENRKFVQWIWVNNVTRAASVVHPKRDHEAGLLKKQCWVLVKRNVFAALNTFHQSLVFNSYRSDAIQAFFPRVGGRYPEIQSFLPTRLVDVHLSVFLYIYDERSFEEWNIFSWTSVHCKWSFLNWPRTQSTPFSGYKERLIFGVCSGLKEWEILENKYFEIYTQISIFLDDVILTWVVLEMSQRRLRCEHDFEDLLHGCFAPEQFFFLFLFLFVFLLISCSELHRDQSFSYYA